MDLEADLTGDFPDDFDGNARRVPDALGGIGGVCEGKLNKREAVAGRLEQRHCSVAVLYRRRMDPQRQGAAIGIDHGVPLATFDL